MTTTSLRANRATSAEKTSLRVRLVVGLALILALVSNFLGLFEWSPSLQVQPELAPGGQDDDFSAPQVIGTKDQSFKSEKSHMLSLEPLPYSLHPKWKLWTEMNSDEQDAALKEAGAYLYKYGKLITIPTDRGQGKKIQGNCEMFDFNGHNLCGPKPISGNCTFISFGINDDASFDIKLATDWGCRGFAGDPTVHHPSKLHPLVTFHNVGASMLSDNEERKINKGGAEEWWTTSMPKLRYWLGLQHIHVVKLDCEGCEYALARDILREDPDYLKHVDQISIETHVTRTWLNTREELYYFALHFALLEEAGFRLEWSNIFGCSKRHEVEGCMPELLEFDFPCGYRPWPGKPKVVFGRSCQDFLWKRY